MFSQKNPPWVPEARESDHIRASWIALGTRDAGDMREGSHPRAWWDPQDKPLRLIPEAVGEYVSFYFGGVYLLPQLTLGAASLSLRCWGVQRGGRAAHGEHWGTSWGWEALSQPSPVPEAPVGQQGHEGRGLGWQLEQAIPLHKQPKTTCSTLFPGLNFPSVPLFKSLAFTYHLGWLSGLVPYPKKYKPILSLHGLGSVSEGPGSIFCLLGDVSEVLKDCKVNIVCWLHNTGTALPPHPS